MDQHFAKDTTEKILKKWANVAPLYESYGMYLIKSYPVAFGRYYLWPNTLKFYAPPVEFLSMYNMGRDTVAEMAVTWFHYKNKKVTKRVQTLQVTWNDFYPVFTGSVNIMFLFSVLFFFMLQGSQKNKTIYRSTLLAGGAWSANFLFSVFAAPVALRFQLFPLTISYFFTLLVLEYIYKVAFITSISNQSALGIPTRKEVQISIPN
jgi:hypothetical protein